MVRHLLGRYREQPYYRGTRCRLSTMASQLTFDLALPPPTYAREDFVRGRRQSRGAGLDRPLARLAGAGAGAERPAGQRQDPSRRASGRREQAPWCWRAADLEGKSVADLVGADRGIAARSRSTMPGAPERALFHLYNLMRERRGYLLVVARAAGALVGSPCRISPRALRAAPAVAVAPPDDELLGSIILKQLADRQLHAGAAASCNISCRTWNVPLQAARRGRGSTGGAGRAPRDRLAAWRPTCWRSLPAST